MINEKYINKIKEILKKYLNEDDRVFIFGSSVESERFNDIDLGIISKNADTERVIRNIKEDLEESILPYKFDVIDINKTEDKFKKHVLNSKIIWII